MWAGPLGPACLPGLKPRPTPTGYFPTAVIGVTITFRTQTCS
jgi:hypothetical protein